MTKITVSAISLILSIGYVTAGWANGDGVPKLPPVHDQLPLRVKSQPPAQSVAPKIQAERSKAQIWNLKNADIRAVIQTISMLTGKNFIIDPRVQGKITLVSQKPMTPDEMYHVFLSLLQVLNYSAIPSGNVIKIVPAMNAKEMGVPIANRIHPGQGDALVARVVPVRHVSAAQLVPIIRPLMQQWGSVSAYVPSNTLILVGSAKNVQHMIEIVRHMDNRTNNRISVVRLKHGTAKEIVKIVTDLENRNRTLGRFTNVAVVADPAINGILISGNLQNQIAMRQLIRQLDLPGATNVIRTVVVHLDYLDAKKLAPVLSKIAKGESFVDSPKVHAGRNPNATLPQTSSTVAAVNRGTTYPPLNGEEISGDISIQPEEQDNALVIRGTRSAIREIKSVIAKLDVRPREVLVQAIIVKVDENVVNQLGIQWGAGSTESNPTVNGDPTTSTQFNQGSLSLRMAPGIGFLNGMSLQAVIQALKSTGSSDILATPSIMVLNNNPAVLSDGRNIGVVNRTYAQDNATTNATNDNGLSTAFNTIERKDVALTLKVTPQISPDDTLRLKIKQEDDSVDPSSTDPTNPVIDTAKITTSVLVRSGSVLVLGGLISNEEQKSNDKVPILGDIPIIGQLFRFKRHSIQKKNLMVFIRPVIVDSDITAKRETMRNYQYVRSRELDLRQRNHRPSYEMPILPPISPPHLKPLPVPQLTVTHEEILPPDSGD